MILDLTAGEQAIVKEILAKYAPEIPAVVFGSRSTGKSRPQSDLDICLMIAENLSLEQLARIKDAFDNSTLPMKVDIVDWSITDAAFQSIIKQSGQPLV